MSIHFLLSHTHPLSLYSFTHTITKLPSTATLSLISLFLSLSHPLASPPFYLSSVHYSPRFVCTQEWWNDKRFYSLKRWFCYELIVTDDGAPCRWAKFFKCQQPIDIKRNRPLIGPARLPLLTVGSSHVKTHFGAVCWASVLIYPRIQRHGCMQWPACQLWQMSSLFLLDVYATTFLCQCETIGRFF